MKPISFSPTGFAFRPNHPFRRLVLAFGLLYLGAYWLAGGPATNAPAQWPRLAEVLKKWDATPWVDVEKAAEGGELTAQHYLGYCYTEGHRGQADVTLGVAWYLRAGDAGYMPSLSNLGVLYQRGKGVPQDYSKTLYYYQRAAEGGYVPANRYIGYLYRDGLGVQRDYREAMKWFRRAADQGDTAAMAETGRLYRFGQGVPMDLDEALRWFQKGAEKGGPLAELNLGLLYEEEGNAEAAFKLYREAAEQDLADAMFKLYQCYWDGVGVALDRNEARKWLEKGAEASSARAQFALGYLYEYPHLDDDSNKLRVISMSQAVKWYQRAADQKHPDAQRYLADCYLEGKGVEKDEERGLELIRNAVDQGDAHALSELAELYAAGIGEPRNAQEEPIQLWQRIVASEPSGDYWFLGLRRAYNEIIFRLLSGLGTPRDPVAAAGWYCRAALAGVEGYSLDEKAEAGHPLLRPFDLYVRPWHRDRNFVPSTWVEVEQHNAEFRRALSLYREAAGARKPNASLQIAEMYAAGRDVPPNPVKAWLWFTIAAQNSSADARAKIAEIESRMTGNELKEARQLLPGLIEELNHATSALREPAERQEGH